jgi:hypothetical protein
MSMDAMYKSTIELHTKVMRDREISLEGDCEAALQMSGRDVSCG